VTAVRFWSLGEVTRVAIEVSSEFHYRSDQLDNPGRLFFDILGAKPEMVAKGMHVTPVGDALLKQIRIAETQPGVTRVVLDLEQPAQFTASQLSRPSRLMIELRLKDRPAPPATPAVTGVQKLAEPNTRATELDLVTSAEPPAASDARAATAPESSHPAPRKFEPPPARVLSLPVQENTQLLAQPTVAILARPGRVPAPVAVSVGTPSLATTASIPPPPDLSATLAKPEPVKSSTVSRTVPETDALPAKRNTNGDRSLTRVLGLKLSRVVLDAGHGGHDVGTHGPSGLYEKDVVLDVTKRLGQMLEDRLGSEVTYTRSDDTFVPLEERTRIANEAKADLFLSIHANSSPFRTAAGVETYYLNFTTSKAALDVAARENASSDRSIYDLQELLQKIALKDKIDESREFASRLQTALFTVSARGNAAAKNRGIKKAPFIVLIGATMPSVLAEIGFLTNSADESVLRKPDQRQRIAEALFKGISSYADTLSHFEVAKSN
jgi:N-acetylmuramoyl-L-alanine amidase